jgi:hypothetical protein
LAINCTSKGRLTCDVRASGREYIKLSILLHYSDGTITNKQLMELLELSV